MEYIKIDFVIIYFLKFIKNIFIIKIFNIYLNKY